MKFAVLGAGSWGTAMAIHVQRSGSDVFLIPRREEHAESMREIRENKDYLPGFPLVEGVHIRADLEEIRDLDVIFMGCPSKGLRDLGQRVAGILKDSKPKVIIALCKGLELGSKEPPVTVLKELLPDHYCGILSGPNFAGEVAQGRPTASTLALDAPEDVVDKVQGALSTPELRIYRSKDLLGVEYAGCLKNVYAIGSGICDGLELGDNAKSAYLTRAMTEMVRIGVTLGGELQTSYGLSGFGDLVATSFGGWSRNRTFGNKIAMGASAESIVNSQKSVVEGYVTTKIFYELLDKYGLEAPILTELYSILYSNKSSKEAIKALMLRDLKQED